MKVANLFSFVALFVLAPTALGWTNEDHEIFDIVSSLQLAEGKDTTFYSFLKVPKDANETVISKAYRKRSIELHPDKNPDDKVVADRFARMGTIAAILRDSEKRARYDFFEENGVPKWRGTGYYYSRYRPGFGFVIGCLAIFSNFVQWIFLKGKYRMEVLRFEQFIDQTKAHAWGPTKQPLAGKKKIQVKTAPGPGLAAFGGDSSLSSQGQDVMMVWEGHDCWLVDPVDGSESLLTKEVIQSSSWRDLWIPETIVSTYQSLTGTPPSPPVIVKGRTRPADENWAPAPPLGPNGKPLSKVQEMRRKKLEELEMKEKEKSEKEKRIKGPMKGVMGAGKVGGRRRKEVSRPPKKDVAVVESKKEVAAIESKKDE